MVSGAIRTKCPSSELCSVTDHFHWLLLDNQKLIYTCCNSPSSCVSEQKSLFSAGFSAVPLLGPCVLLSCLSGIEVSHILHLSVFNAFGRFPHRRLRCSDTAALFTAGSRFRVIFWFVSRWRDLKHHSTTARPGPTGLCFTQPVGKAWVPVLTLAWAWREACVGVWVTADCCAQVPHSGCRIHTRLFLVGAALFIKIKVLNSHPTG